MVFIFQDFHVVADKEEKYLIGSITFVLTIEKELAYLDENLKLITAYKNLSHVDFASLYSAKTDFSNKNCLCINGQVKLRIGIISKPFYLFNIDEYNDNGLKFETYALDLFQTLAKSLKIR